MLTAEADIPFEALIVALRIPHQIKFYVSFGFPDLIHPCMLKQSLCFPVRVSESPFTSSTFPFYFSV